MIPVPVVILVILSAFTWYLLKYTRLGRHIYAIGGNAQAAVVSGVNEVSSTFYISGIK